MGLVPAIRFLRDQFEGPFAINLQFDPDLQKRIPPRHPDCEALILDLFLTVEDLLSNCVKHARCSTVDISMSLIGGAPGTLGDAREPFDLELTVKDDGVGFDVDRVSHGLGMTNIRDRITLHDGRLEIHSQVGAGSRFVITVPCSGSRG